MHDSRPGVGRLAAAAASLTVLALAAVQAAGATAASTTAPASAPTTTTAPAPASVSPRVLDEQAKLAQRLEEQFGEGYRVRIDNRRGLLYVTAADGVPIDYVMKVLGAYGDALRRGLFRAPIRWNITIVIPTLSDFHKMSLRDEAAGFYRRGSKMVVSASLSTTLIHEFTHALHHCDQAAVGQVHALWIVEGLATLYQDSKIGKNGQLEINDGPSLALAQEAIREGKALPLSRLMAAGTSTFMDNDSVCYPQARSVMLYLYRTGKLERFYEHYKDSYDRDRTGKVALAEATGEDFEQFEANWRKWVLAQKAWRPGVKTKAYLGIRMAGDAGGVKVAAMLRGSPAARTRQLKVGDIIVSVAGRGTPTPRALVEAIDACQPGSIVAMEVIRGENRIVVQQVLGFVRERREATSQP